MIEDQCCVTAGAQQMFFGWYLAEILIAGRADEGKVAMPLDESRHKKLPVPIDDLSGVLTGYGVESPRDGLDAIVLDDDFAWIFLVVDAVPNGHIAKKIGRHGRSSDATGDHASIGRLALFA